MDQYTDIIKSYDEVMMKKSIGDSQECNVVIVGRNIEITNPIRSYVTERVNKIKPFTPHILDVLVKLDIQKVNHNVAIIIKFSHFKIKVHAMTFEMYATIDKAFDKLRAKIFRWKDRIQDHHAKAISATELEVSILKVETDALDHFDEDIAKANNDSLVKHQFTMPVIMKKKKRMLKTLRLDEAMMKMELSNDNFMVFNNEEDQKLKVIYRRRDGHYGLIATE